MGDNNKHKFIKNSRYFTICVYVLITVCVGAVLLKAIWEWASTVETFSRIIGVISPFLIGIFIAYLMNPLVKSIDKWILFKLFRIKKQKIRKFLSITVAYVFVIGIVIICISTIVPEIYQSLKSIYEGASDNYNKLLIFLEKVGKEHPDMNMTYITNLAKENSSNIINFVQGSIGTVLPFLYNTSVMVISWTINMIIAIMVSCYMVIDKDKLLRNIKRLMYALIKKERADRLVVVLRDCNKIFGSFIIGKTIDSTIIGIMCFIFMSMLKLKYAMLISVVVGITNMIPYFGPFIGAVPGIILLLTADWRQAIIFAVLILVLQQFDGLYLGPKILGDSIGIRPIWIMFAITVGGYLAGPVGMFLGVPTVGVIAFLINKHVDKKLREKNIDM